MKSLGIMETAADAAGYQESVSVFYHQSFCRPVTSSSVKQPLPI